MKKIFSKFFILVMCACLLTGISISTSAARISTCLNDNLVLNVYTWGTPAPGDKVSLWSDTGGLEQRWLLSGTANSIYIISMANTSVTVACAGDYSAVMEYKNDVYGEWQQHSIEHGDGIVRQFPNKGTGYALRLRVADNASSGSFAYYGDIGAFETDTSLSWFVE